MCFLSENKTEKQKYYIQRYLKLVDGSHSTRYRFSLPDTKIFVLAFEIETTASSERKKNEEKIERKIYKILANRVYISRTGLGSRQTLT